MGTVLFWPKHILARFVAIPQSIKTITNVTCASTQDSYSDAICVKSSLTAVTICRNMSGKSMALPKRHLWWGRQAVMGEMDRHGTWPGISDAETGCSGAAFGPLGQDQGSLTAHKPLSFSKSGTYTYCPHIGHGGDVEDARDVGIDDVVGRTDPLQSWWWEPTPSQTSHGQLNCWKGCWCVRCLGYCCIDSLSSVLICCLSCMLRTRLSNIMGHFKWHWRIWVARYGEDAQLYACLHSYLLQRFTFLPMKSETDLFLVEL